MGEPLATIPVHVVLNDKTALLGAAYWGTQLFLRDIEGETPRD